MPFPTCKHHIVFISAQNVPNYLAAVMPDAGTVYMHAVVSDRMVSQSDILQKTWEKRGGKYIKHKLPQITQTAIAALLDTIYEQCGKESLGINLTGGTKLMALAAYEWADVSRIPACYVDTTANELMLLGREWQSENLPDLLDFKTLLSLYGYDIQKENKDPVPEYCRRIFPELLSLVLHNTKGQRALSALNAWAASAGKSLVATLTETFPEADALLDICARAGKLHRDGNKLIFTDEHARLWCNGIWLEEYTRSVLWQLQHDGKIKSWAASVELSRAGVKNEIDALFTKDNRLYIIECKTAKMRDSHSTPATDILYKADSLHDRLGGIYAKSMLCSIATLSDNESMRAQEMKITVISGKKLERLKEHIIQWITKS